MPNPNVMLEIGYARALKKPVLLLTSEPDTLPFDLRTQRALVYEPRAVGGGAFHKDLVSFVDGIVAACGRNGAAGQASAPGNDAIYPATMTEDL